jgi:pyruvate,water dikinase
MGLEKNETHVTKMKKLLKGLGVSKGKVQGKVKIIKNFDDHFKFQEGDILVTKITDPTMVVLMGKAKGIICDIGGLTSHPSILSREMGIPCIVSASCEKTKKKATEILKDGMIISMCGESGEIHLIEEKTRRKLKW